MDLPTLWFVIITYLFCGFFLLEGFDYGVGMVLPFVSKDPAERRTVMSSIGGVWDGNEVWLITSGAVMFAAFPNWYATLFSGFYLALVAIVLALIFRGVSIKFRNQREEPGWQLCWERVFSISSALLSFLWGVAVGNILRGVPVNERMMYTGSFFDLLNPYALVTGLAFVGLFSLHGLLFLNLRLTGDLLKKVQDRFLAVYIPAVLIAVVFIGYSFFEIGLLQTFRECVLVGATVMALLICGASLVFGGCSLTAFIFSGLTIVGVTVTAFVHLYPNVLPSTLDPRWSLTVYNASSSPYALKVMSIVALFFIPPVLFYQGWAYWVLRKRIDPGEGH